MILRAFGTSTPPLIEIFETQTHNRQVGTRSACSLIILFSLFRGQGTQVEVVYISEESAMSPLFMRIPVASVVVAVLAPIPESLLSNLVLKTYLTFGSTCIDAAGT